MSHNPGAVSLSLLLVLVGVVSFGACRASDRPPGALDRLMPGAARGSNLLLVTLDTTRADRLGSYGYARAVTPALDALAARGIRFADAVTVAGLTLPAHSSLHTGLYPPGHGVRINGQPLGDSYRTLAEILSDEGYQTAAFVSAFVLDARFNLDQGFDRYDDRVDPTLESGFGGGNERSAGAVTAAALDWLRVRDAGRPFFVWVHYFDPHHRYEPPAEFGLRFADRPYDGEIAYVDSELDKLVKALDAQGVAPRTVIVAAGDHGESLGDHGERFHGRTVYESVMHVPLILSAPGLLQDATVVRDRVVSLVDVLPTVLDLFGVPVPPGIDGQSLLDAGARSSGMVYMEAVAGYLDNGWAPLYAARSHDEKYIEAPRPEHYALRSDPGELENAYREGSSSAAFVAHLSALRKQSPALDVVISSTSAAPIDGETRSRLAALGYTSGLGTGETGPLPDPKDMLPVYERMIEADAMMRAGRHEEALALLREAVRAYPKSREALQRLGETYALTNRLDEAERTLRLCLAMGMHPPAATMLAQVLTKAKRFDEAARLLDEAAAVDPRYGALYVARGDLAALQGRPAEAIRFFEQALKVDPYRTPGVVRDRIAAVRHHLARPRPAVR